MEKKESDLGKDVEEQQAALQAKAAEKKEQEQPTPASSQIPDQPSVKVSFPAIDTLHYWNPASLLCHAVMPMLTSQPSLWTVSELCVVLSHASGAAFPVVMQSFMLYLG